MKVTPTLVRLIVGASDRMIDIYTKKELKEMGSEKYYQVVADTVNELMEISEKETKTQ